MTISLEVIGGPRRECGGCRECCSVVAVEALGKPYRCDCEYLDKAGCRIYRRRPGECKVFKCTWLSGLGLARDRPDRSGLLFTMRPEEGLVYLDIHECRPGAFAATAEKSLNELIDDASRMIPPGCGDFGGVCLFPYVMPQGAAWPARPPYSDALNSYRMTFQEITPGSGVLLYLGPSLPDGRILYHGELVDICRADDIFAEVQRAVNSGVSAEGIVR